MLQSFLVELSQLFFSKVLDYRKTKYRNAEFTESVREKSNYTMNTVLQFNSWSEVTSLNNVHIASDS